MSFKINVWRIIAFAGLILSVSGGIKAQVSPESQVVLATANNGKTYSVADLTPEAIEVWQKAGSRIAELRESFLDNEIGAMLFAEEAAARKTTVAKMLDLEVKRKIPNPTETEIKEFYEAKKSEIGNQTFEEVRPRIVGFLKYQREIELTGKFADKLNAKYKTVRGVNVNSPNLKPTDVLAIINGKTLVAKNLEEKLKPAEFEYRDQVYELVKAALDETVYTDLVLSEARKQKIEPEILVRHEISDKITTGTNEEQAQLQAAFQAKLFRQYEVVYKIIEPPSPVLQVATENQPSRGLIDAPVTVVMFSDFQCSACSRTHPILQEVLREFGDKIRFVVRDFPLTEVHPNAYRAALAANAADAQGKFFEYTEILYQNQSALDDASLKKYAAQIGLNPAKFALDMASAKTAAAVAKDIRDGENLRINSTPTIFINGVKARDLSAEGFRNQINKALAEKSAKK